MLTLSDVQGNLGNAPDTARIGQNGGAAGGELSSHLPGTVE